MRRALSLLTVVVGGSVCVVSVVGCDHDRVPSELRPGFDAMLGLPFNICTEVGEPVSLLVRNIGDSAVTISSVSFTATADHDSELSSFDEPSIDVEELLADDEAFVVFTYRVPGGLAQHATIVVESDAEENPTLVVPVETQELAAPEEEKAEFCD